jgi:hypothetical protein
MAGEYEVMSKVNFARQVACFEAEDNRVVRIPGVSLIMGDRGRNPENQAARLAHQFLRQNQGLLNDFGIDSRVYYDGVAVELRLRTGGRVGALPLLSPTSGRPDYGLIIKPRFGWQGIGPMLGAMGWKILPEPLALPLLPRSDRKIPPWVLSTTILLRLQRLLKQLERRFEYTSADLQVPKGRVDWGRYATVKIARAAYDQVPSTFPDLRDDREIKGAIHYTLRKQLSGLQSQRTAGVVVLQLIRLCRELLEQVRDVPALRPSQNRLNSWLFNRLHTEAFKSGLQAVEWTIDDRGLAGLSDLQGLPWMLSMEQFFEAWVETVISRLARNCGGQLRSGRQRQTITPLSWTPPYCGSQRYLLPDLILERSGETIIFDAKYKSHFEELELSGWRSMEQAIQEQHRADLLQVLAYSTVPDSKKITCCLAYPCRIDTWQSLLKRERPYHKAAVRAGSRQVELILTAFPMGVDPEEIETVVAQAVGG